MSVWERRYEGFEGPDGEFIEEHDASVVMRDRVTIIQDAGGEAFLPIPDDMLDELGISEGDDLELEVVETEDGTELHIRRA